MAPSKKETRILDTVLRDKILAFYGHKAKLKADEEYIKALEEEIADAVAPYRDEYGKKARFLFLPDEPTPPAPGAIIMGAKFQYVQSKSVNIQRGKLIAEGVDPEIIDKCTKSTPYEYPKAEAHTELVSESGESLPTEE